MTGARPLIGRSADLRWLRRHFDVAAGMTDRPQGPRMAVLVGESGLGKSRIVQELYLQLTTDPTWDPPAVNYWPDVFTGLDDQLRVNPDMTGHVPAGPPELLWLGARWSAPDARNVHTRRTALMELLDELTVHAKLLERHQDGWKGLASRGARSLAEGGAEHLIELGVDLFLPQGSALLKLARGAGSLLRDNARASRTAEVASRTIATTASEALTSTLHELMGRRVPVPVVVWLDDAQWIDIETATWLDEIWRVAERNSWPLLVVATHWEREWHESLGVAGSLREFEGRDGVEIHTLAAASNADLHALVSSALPGLTPSQVEALIAKAAGNYLAMVENIGVLRQRTRNFVDGDPAGSLSPQGEREVEEWSSERDVRVRQRFRELSERDQDLLGWGSHLGVRFIEDVVAEFARQEGREEEAPLDRLVIPYVILSRSKLRLIEFRDRAYHRLATEYFDRYLGDARPRLMGVLRGHLVRWLAASFQDGELIKGEAAPAHSAAGWLQTGHRAEVGELLATCRELLTLSVKPDWSDEIDVAALRTLLLSIEVAADVFDWRLVREVGEAISGLDWASVPPAVAGSTIRILAGLSLEFGGAVGAAVSIFREEVAADRRRRDIDALMFSLELLADATSALGDHVEGDTLLRERVAVSSRGPDRATWANAVQAQAWALFEREIALSAALARELEDALDVLRAEVAGGEVAAIDALAEGLRIVAGEASERHDTAKELAALDEILELRRRQHAAAPDSMNAFELGRALLLRAIARPEAEGGVGLLDEAERLARDLVLIPDPPGLAELLADVLVARAESAPTEQAIPLLREHLALHRGMMERESTPARAEGLATAANTLATRLAEVDPKAAVDLSLDALTVLRDVLGHREDDGAAAALGRALVEHAKLIAMVELDRHMDAGLAPIEPPSTSLSLMEEAVAIWRRLAERDQSGGGHFRNLGWVLDCYAEVLEGAGRVDEARAAYKEAVVSYRRAEPDGSEPELQSMIWLCELLFDSDVGADALPLLDRAHQVAASLHARSPSEESAGRWISVLRMQSLGSELQADPLHERERWAAAARTLAEDYPCQEVLDDAASIVDATAGARAEQGDVEGAAAGWLEVVGWKERLAHEFPDRGPDLTHGVALHNLADIEGEAGRQAAAASFAQRALVVLRALLARAQEGEAEEDVDLDELGEMIRDLRPLARASRR